MSDNEPLPGLLNEHPRLVYPSLARMLRSADRALVLQQLHFLLSITEKAKSKFNFVDDRWWVYNNYDEWQKEFPWLSTSTIQRIFLWLEDAGIVDSIQSVKHKSDRRKWYSIDYDTYCTLHMVWEHWGKTDPSYQIDMMVDHVKMIRWNKSKCCDGYTETTTETTTKEKDLSPQEHGDSLDVDLEATAIDVDDYLDSEQSENSEQLKIFCGDCNGSGTVLQWEQADGCPECGVHPRDKYNLEGESPGATIDDSPLTPDEIAHGHELAEEHGLLDGDNSDRVIDLAVAPVATMEEVADAAFVPTEDDDWPRGAPRLPLGDDGSGATDLIDEPVPLPRDTSHVAQLCELPDGEPFTDKNSLKAESKPEADKKKRKPTINVQILHAIYAGMDNGNGWDIVGIAYGGQNGKITKSLKAWGATPDDIPGYMTWLHSHYLTHKYNNGKIVIGSVGKECNWREYQAVQNRIKQHVQDTDESAPLSASDGVVRFEDGE